jgi:hypothetical protein
MSAVETAQLLVVAKSATSSALVPLLALVLAVAQEV